MTMTTDTFRKSTFVETYAAGTLIFAEGQKGNVMYVIQEGQVDIRIKNRIVETLGVGEMFGEMALIDNAPRSASAIAKTDCKVAPVDQRRFAFLVQQTPYFALKLIQVMSERLRHMHTLVDASQDKAL